MFHHFHSKTHKPDTANSLSKNQFERILNFVGIKNILSADEWIFLSNKNKLKANHRCITFDDGLKSQFDVALPVLNKYKLKAFWFIYSAQYDGKYPRLDVFRRFRYHYYNKIEDYYKNFFFQAKVKLSIESDKYRKWKKNQLLEFPFYSEDDVKYRYVRDVLLSSVQYFKIVDKIIKSRGLSYNDLISGLWLTKSDLVSLNNQGHIIGLHSYDHPTNLKKLNKKQQKNQYIKNIEFIKKFCSNPISMSHPCNSYNKTTLKILSDIGIRVGFRANMHPTSILKFQKKLQFPREDSANLLFSLRNIYTNF